MHIMQKRVQKFSYVTIVYTAHVIATVHVYPGCLREQYTQCYGVYTTLAD